MKMMKRLKETSKDIKSEHNFKKSDSEIFNLMLKCVEKKFKEVERQENEPDSVPEVQAAAPIAAVRSFNDDFPDVPTPMTPSF